MHYEEWKSKIQGSKITTEKGRRENKNPKIKCCHMCSIFLSVFYRST